MQKQHIPVRGYPNFRDEVVFPGHRRTKDAGFVGLVRSVRKPKSCYRAKRFRALHSEKERYLALGSGCYLLLVGLRRRCRITVGALGEVLFPPGTYVYVGSGRRGIGGRVSRHWQRNKRLYWHIDRLLEAGEVLAVAALEGTEECELASAVGEVWRPLWSVEGFGSSDCGCRSHLFRLSGGSYRVLNGFRAMSGKIARVLEGEVVTVYFGNCA